MTRTREDFTDREVQLLALARPHLLHGYANAELGSARNPQTYAPVQTFGEGPVNPSDPSADTDTTTEEWLPATSENIANAQLGQIPANYTQVSQTELEKANPAGR